MYTYHYGGKDSPALNLLETKDLVVVRTQNQDLLDLNLSPEARALVTHMLPVGGFPEAQVSIYKVLSPSTQGVLKHRNAIRKVLPQEKGIRYAGRVLKDQQTGTVTIYTENFFIQFSPDCSSAECKALIQGFGLQLKEELGFAPNAFFVEAPEGTGLKIFEIAATIIKHPKVQLAHPELVQQKSSKAIHPQQWHLQETMVNRSTVRAHIEVEKAWQHTKGEKVTIAVIDDGVDVDHEEFQSPGKIVAPRDTIVNRNDARPKFSTEKHGTACAGVACADGLHQASGVAPAAKLMPIRSGGLGSMAEAKAFQWAADQGADVISCSWGPRDGLWSDPNDPLHTRFYHLPDSSRLAIDYAVDKGRSGKGCAIVWAAGNGNEDVKFDAYASNPKVITVAASNDRNMRSVYSDYGQAVWCCFPSNDLPNPQTGRPAPRTNGIWTTDRSNEKGYNPGNMPNPFQGDPLGNYIGTFGGTSSACPGVAGVLALMLSINPDLDWFTLKQLVRWSCDRIDNQPGVYDDTGHSLFYGYGKINALKAVLNAKSSLGPQDHFDIQGWAYFSKHQKLTLQEGKLSKDRYHNNRLLGIRLTLRGAHAGVGLRYRVNIQKLGMGKWKEDGGLAETSDKRRKIIGFAVQLIGGEAKNYSVIYSARIKGKKQVLTAKDGAICGTSSKSGKSILDISIEVINK